MTESPEHCQYYYSDLAIQTSPDTRVALPLRKHWWRLKSLVWHVSVLGPRKSMQRISRSTKLGRLVSKGRLPRQASGSIPKESLGLKSGEWVEVRSAKEILATLDQHGKLKGLTFTPEMVKFCGKRFKVYKRLENIILEATGELRRIKSPTVLLEGVFCDGEAHGRCDRSCFCFWREAWLRRIDPDPPVMRS
jgi:hypothetical protein